MNPKAYCRRRKINLRQFAREMGIGAATASRLFNGIPIGIKAAIKIEEKTGGAIKRTDVRPDLRPISRKQRAAMRDSVPTPGTVSGNETPRQPEQTAPAMQAAAISPAPEGDEHAPTEV